MSILSCGGGGFIGRAIAAALQARGHKVLRDVRSASAPPHFSASPGSARSSPNEVPMDSTRDTTENVWLPRLELATPTTPSRA